MIIDLSKHHIKAAKSVYRNLTIDELIEHAIANKEAIKSKTGAIVVYTGKYTGRSPKDRFIVDSPEVHDKIDWGKINVPLSEDSFDRLYKKIGKHLSEKETVYIFDGFAGADKKHQLHVRVISEYAYQSLFMRHLLRRPTTEELKSHSPTLTVICAPNCKADPKVDGTNSEVFVVLNLKKMIILIGGTKYAGEMKKSVFSALNYLLPQSKSLPMHASVNVGKDGDAALFFGLSGTGKTTLSADPDRLLIGDDEHGWNEHGLFNFEGGCYAKCINLKEATEPLIWRAIRHGALVENAVLTSEGEFDFADSRYTENTRVAYPLDYIENFIPSGQSPHPKTIILLTADASGVLPPIAKLSPEGAVYHFLSGYTSKIAGTERGIKEPKPTFSAYFGAPFMPLKPEVYAQLFQRYITKYGSNVYLVNTGWSGGAYGVGKRISLDYTRKIVTAALQGQLERQSYYTNALFNLRVPTEIPGVPSELLFPRDLWTDTRSYDINAQALAKLFVENFKKFPHALEQIRQAGPHI